MGRPETKLESPDTLLGQLQRGQGRGYLAAREAKDVDALLHCIHHDPRWDRQVERRDVYYARLAIDLDVDMSAIAAHFDEDADLNLTAEVLVELGERGVMRAFDVLRAALRSTNWRAALRGLRVAQSDRVESLLNKAELSALMEHEGLEDVVWDDAEWRLWSKLEPRLLPLMRVDAGPAETKRRTEAAPKADTSMSTDALLSIVCRENIIRVTNVLLHRRDAKSVAALRASASTNASVDAADQFARWTALRVLAERGDPCALPSCEALLATVPVSQERMELRRYIRSLSGKHTLPVARRLLAYDDFREVVALGIFAKHAEAEDRLTLEARLEELLDAGHLRCTGDVADALGVIGNAESAPLLEAGFHRVAYAYVRRHFIRGLHPCDAQRALALASDALYDSDDGTRLWAAKHVPWDAQSTARLAELAEDELEWGDIRAVAAKRLDASR